MKLATDLLYSLDPAAIMRAVGRPPDPWQEKALFGGLPDVSNADFERCFGVTMSTIRKRGAQAKSILIL